MKPKKSTLSQDQMRREIAESHKRSIAYDVCREERNPDQERLTPEQLEEKRRLNQDFIAVAYEHIDEIYELLSPDRFMVAVVDREGYILHLSGSDTIKADFAERNCAPGFRFTEKDVGTTAISLSLKKRIPIQLNDQDHFCIRAHGFTSSAAPIFTKDDFLQGLLVVSGKSDLVHPHTLVMVIAAARSIEKQLRLIRRNKEMSIYTGFLDNVLESAETGLLALDNDLRIWKTNRKAKRILKQENLDGKPISVLKGLTIDLENLYRNPDIWKEKECHLKINQQNIHLVLSAQPVISKQGRKLGAVLVFEEFSDIRKIADKISESKAYFTFDHLIGESPAFGHAIAIAQKASKTISTVLLMGETGTGKELFAQAIHNAGPFKTKPFIPINCGAIPGELMESELFGYVDGAFSGALKGGRPGKFELASGGTILLDEIGDMPHSLQVKLLRVLQTGEVQRIGSNKVINVNTRIIASTNVNLLNAIAENRFRQDLYYRLNILRIKIPPLRERGEKDIKRLAAYFLKRFDPQCNFTADALKLLTTYDWPGNVRELENTIERAFHISDGEQLEPKHLGSPLTDAKPICARTGSLREMEKEIILATLERTQYNMAETAKVLGISRATLYRKVKAYKLVKASSNEASGMRLL
ncbi:MAG: sigma 54-interacting transcriptional regulator [Desulfobacterales bacterium]|nr:sigma 54-interacting transcriptional regulator [Desulfobacterales bacterium]